MSIISCIRSNFDRSWGVGFNGTHPLNVSWEDLVWAAITVGKPGLPYLFSHSWHSISDILVRMHTVYANLREEGNSYHKSSYYHALDPTEKAASSYFLGMMAAKVVAAKVLDVPWLFHLSMLSPLGGVPALIGKSAPDLIGLNRKRQWAVVEAKGRTNKFDADAAGKAKKQTRQLRRINGDLPFVRVAVQAYFSPAFEFAVDDPEEYDDNAVDFDGDVKLAFRRYYSFANAVTSTSNDIRTIDGEQFAFGTLDESGLSIGLSRKTSSMIESGTIETRPERVVNAGSNQPIHVYPDGIAISLDQRWSTDQMKIDVRDRIRTDNA